MRTHVRFKRPGDGSTKLEKLLMRSVRKALRRAWRHLAWRFRDPDFDGLDLRDAHIHNGIISRKSQSRHANAPEIFLTPIIDGETLIIRVPVNFLNVNQIDIEEGDKLKISRDSSRSIIVEAIGYA